MDEESKYRVEKEEDLDQQEPRGFLRPLPESEKKPTGARRGKGAMTKLLGISMYENTRDILVLLIMPLFVGLIDANFYALVVIDVLPNSALYLFAIPAIAAVPVGLTAGKTSHGLFGGMVCAVYFIIFLELFFITPALMAPDAPFGDFVIAGLWLNFVYMFFVVFASLLGGLVGAIAREFF
ncbi:MAG: hypothetical protein JW779_01255 [Candidatus Thorarchaeota archaeon]|nr:hypothetical protein [Candidatus Thorarchaeota archaeon]